MIEQPWLLSVTPANKKIHIYYYLLCLNKTCYEWILSKFKLTFLNFCFYNDFIQYLQDNMKRPLKRKQTERKQQLTAGDSKNLITINSMTLHLNLQYNPILHAIMFIQDSVFKQSLPESSGHFCGPQNFIPMCAVVTLGHKYRDSVSQSKEECQITSSLIQSLVQNFTFQMERFN